MTGNTTFLEELRRRKVVRVALLYAAGAFALLEFADIAFPRIGLPDSAVDVVLGLGLVGFPFVVALAWFLEVRAEQPETDQVTGIHWLTWRTVVAIVLLVLGGALIGRWSSSETTPSDALIASLQPTIAILPFDNLSSGDEGDFLV